MGYRKAYVIMAFFVVAALVAGGCYRRTPEQQAEGIIRNLADKLDLNDSQKAKLNEMKNRFLANVPETRKVRGETFDEMIALMKSPSIDQNKLNGLVQRNRKQADEMIGFIFASFREFHDMLTPEQREKAAKEMERWKQRYRK